MELERPILEDNNFENILILDAQNTTKATIFTTYYGHEILGLMTIHLYESEQHFPHQFVIPSSETITAICFSIPRLVDARIYFSVRMWKHVEQARIYINYIRNIDDKLLLSRLLAVVPKNQIPINWESAKWLRL